MSRTRTILLLFLAAALAVRLSFALTRPAEDESLRGLPDQVEYLSIARNILHGNGIQFFDPAFGQTVYAYRMPGYPLFIAACGANVLVVRTVQCLIDASTILAAFLIARRFGLGWATWIAVAFVAFNPYLIYFSSLLLSETLFTAMLLWGMWALLGERKSVRFIGIVVLALSIFVRPSAVALAVLFAVVAARARGQQWKRCAAEGLLAVIVVFACLLPWAIRNMRVLGDPIFGTTNDGFSLYDGYNPDADGSSNQAGFRAWPQLKQMGEVERSRYLTELAKKYAVEHPERDLRLIFARLERFWSPIPLSSEYGGRSIYVVAGLLFTLPLFILAVIGGFCSGILPKNARIYLLVPAIYFSTIHAFTVGSLRYRVPVDVPLAILAGAGASVCSNRRRALPVISVV